VSEARLLSLAFLIYLASGIFYAVIFFKKKSVWTQRGARVVFLAALVVHAAALIVRAIMMGHAPFTNMYESLVFFAWSFGLCYFLADLFLKMSRVGFFAVVFSLMLLMYAFSHDQAMKPLMPALQSNWLIFHVTTCFLSYGAFMVSFLVSLIYLTPLCKKIASPEKLDLMIYRLILFGFPMLTLGVASGAIWANDAWGVYWGWDPKETWSLITWLIYALYLHLRLIREWGERKLVWVAFLGFLSVIFTYLGVAYFLPGLHSYV
jgi:ABC-type transport system involved in cytochrome c biogenesis permease subunit